MDQKDTCLTALWQRFCLNKVWKDLFVQPVNSEVVLLTIIETALLTIVVAAKPVSEKIKRSSRLCQDGSLRDTRKNPHAIAADLEQDIQHSYWCFT